MKVCSDCGRCYDDVVTSCVEETHPSLSEPRDGDPEMVTGYRLDFLLSSGVKADLYRARQTASDRPCMVRILSADEETSQKFLKEAKLAASFFHPNVADVYEAGRLDSGELFVVSEQTEGQTLRELLQTVGVPQLLTTVQVVRQAAEALHELHLQGLTHRAVRPENIVLTTDLEHRLLVRIQHSDLGGVNEHSIISDKFFIDSYVDSLRYFAPEQFSGETGNAQTDVYALGVVFYEMLAGTPPFEAEKAAELAEKHKHQPPPDVKINNFDLRMLVTHALTESLQKQPSLRQASANTFARQLRHIEQLATHSPTPPPVVSVPQTQSVNTGFYNAAAAIHATPVPTRTAQPVRTIRLETPPEILQEADALQFIAANEIADIAQKIEVESVEAIEPVPISTTDPNAGLTQFSKEEKTFEPEPTLPDHSAENIVTRPVRSRLKAFKKRAHFKTAPHAVETARNDREQESELAVLPLNEVQPEPEELLFLRSKPEVLPARIAPKKIEWEQPEDDVPSEADVLEVLASENPIEMPILDMAPEKPTVVSSVPEFVEILSDEEKADVPFITPEPEEITLVTAPQSRFKVEWDRPYAWRDIYSDDEFSSDDSKPIGYFPTILGNAENVIAFDSDRKGAMFSAYYDHPRRLSMRSRVLMIGSGALALTLVFLFGDEILNRYVQTASSGDSTTVTANPPQAAQPPQTLRPDSAVPIKRTELPKVGDVETPLAMPPSATRREPVASGKQVPEPDEKVTVKAEKPKPEPAVKSKVDVPPARTTLVISSDNGEIKSKIQPAKKSGDTRPRIVANPKP